MWRKLYDVSSSRFAILESYLLHFRKNGNVQVLSLNVCEWINVKLVILLNPLNLFIISFPIWKIDVNTKPRKGFITKTRENFEGFDQSEQPHYISIF